MPTINQAINEHFDELSNKYPHLKLHSIQITVKNVIEKPNYYICNVLGIDYIFKIKEDTNLRELFIDEYERNKLFSLCFDNPCTLTVSKNKTNNNIMNDLLKFDFDEDNLELAIINYEPKKYSYKDNIYYKPCGWKAFNIEPELYIDIEEINMALMGSNDPEAAEMYESLIPFINLIDPSHPYKPKINSKPLTIEDKLNLVNDALEKDEMKK